MDRKISNAPRLKAPGLKRGRHRLPYWIARQVVRDPCGFPDGCIALPPEADMAELASLCQQHTARLMAWIAAREQDAQQANPAGPAVPAYDGTVQGLSRLYQEHPESDFHTVRPNTRRSYTASLKIIERTVGPRRVSAVTLMDVKRWYRRWREPAAENGPERITRAHKAVEQVRTLLRFGAALGYRDCDQLLARLEKAKFERGGAREEEMTYVQAAAFIAAAQDLGARGVIPALRARSMAIGVAAQFELLLRQKDVIGEWSVAPGGESESWRGYFTWENVPGWRWRMRTSKSKYRAAADFDLSKYPLLFPLLEAVPPAERRGAIVLAESRLPVRERSYRAWFRRIARAAGIPDAVWNMDSRAGGATEAEEAGADIADISASLTHTREETTVRYIRRRAARIASVAEARAAKRAGGQGA